MSEIDKSSGPKTGTWIVIGVVGVLVLGGCLVACAGLAGVGFMLPAVRHAEQDERAEAEARQAAGDAEARARAAQPAAPEADGRTPTDATAQPAADDAPGKDDP